MWPHGRPAPLGPGGFVMPTSHAWGGLVAPTDLRPPRGLPARSPSAPRASLGASARSPARPRRPRGGLQSVGGLCVARPGTTAAHGHRRPRGAAVGFSGPPMWSGLSCWDFGALGCVLLQTSSIGGVFRVDYWTVVTNVVNPTAFSLKTVVFRIRLTTFVTEVLARRFKLLRFDDVCNTAAHRSLSQAGVPPPHS